MMMHSLFSTLSRRDPPFAQNISSGFTLIESIVSLTILLGVLGSLVPLYLIFRVSTINNRVATDATAITQRVMDQLRETSWEQYVNLNGSYTTFPSGTSLSNIAIDPSDENSKEYDAVITYCPPDAQPTNACANNTAKFIRVEVFENGVKVDEAHTIYTNLGETAQ